MSSIIWQIKMIINQSNSWNLKVCFSEIEDSPNWELKYNTVCCASFLVSNCSHRIILFPPQRVQIGSLRHHYVRLRSHRTSLKLNGKKHVQHTHSSQTAKQKQQHNASCHVSASHCLSCPTALSHAMTSWGGEGRGGWIDLFNYLLFWSPPPLPSSAGHGMGEGSGHERQWEAEAGRHEQALCCCWLLGCLAAFVCSCLLQFYLSGVRCERRRT